jgi:hypothetical protein
LTLFSSWCLLSSVAPFCFRVSVDYATGEPLPQISTKIIYPLPKV